MLKGLIKPEEICAIVAANVCMYANHCISLTHAYTI